MHMLSLTTSRMTPEQEMQGLNICAMNGNGAPCVNSWTPAGMDCAIPKVGNARVRCGIRSCMAWVVHCEWLWAWMKDNAGSELGDARGEQSRFCSNREIVSRSFSPPSIW